MGYPWAKRILIREEDCGTERNASDDRSVKSHKHNILQYAAFFQSSERRRLFDDARAVVLSTFSSPAKMRNVMNLVLELSGGRGSNFMLFRSWPAFGDRFRPPAPEPDLFIAPWERAGHAPFYLNTLTGQLPEN